MAVRRLHLGPRATKIVRFVGMIFLALITFVFALQATFPYNRVKDKLEELASSKFDITIKEIERGIVPGRFYLKNVTLKTRPSASDLEHIATLTDPKERERQLNQAVTTIYVEQLEVDLGLLGLIKGTATVDLDAKFGKGSIAGRISVSKGKTSIHMVGDDVPSESLPMREVLSNLPMSGLVTFDIDLDLPNEKLKSNKIGPNWLNSAGTAELACPSGCTIGDGHSKLKLKAKNSRSQAFAGEGTDFGTVKIDTLVAHLEIKEGKADLTKFEVKSPDVELHVDYTMTLAQDLNDSVVLGCVRFKGSDALRKREPKTYDQILLTGAARAPDGLDHIRLKGSVKNMLKLPEVCGPTISDPPIDSPSGGTPNARPNLTVQPDDPLRHLGSAAAALPVNPTPPPPPDAGAADAAVTIPIPHPEHEGSAAGAGSSTGSGAGSQDAQPETGTAGAGGAGEPSHKH
ncbi:MAG: hypothetical protein H6Q90_1037 [Deltaproteobacteria bacterium]|nr:hypothetical protein [Deltaproteobacteria bacterium]